MTRRLLSLFLSLPSRFDPIMWKVIVRVSGHDLHATILHLMGIDNERLTYRFNGRDYRLTDVYGKVIQPILA